MDEKKTRFKLATKAPARKVTAGGVAGAVGTVVVFVLNQFLPDPVPPEVAAALTVLLSFAASYWASPAATDQPVQA